MGLVNVGVSTRPAPLQVDDQGEVNLAITAAQTQVYCDEIQVVVFTGDAENALTTDVPSASTNEASWAPQAIEPSVDGSATVTYTCSASPLPALDGNLVLTLSGLIADATGKAPVKARAHAGTDPGTLAWGDWVDLTLMKVPWTFYLRNLVATVPGSPAVPVTEFGCGAPICLQWESNGTSFEVFAKAGGTPLPGVSGTTLSIPGGISTDTTFLVEATRLDSQTLTLYESITLSVADPALTPSSVVSAGDITAANSEVSASSVASANNVAAGAALDGLSLDVTNAGTLGSLAVGSALTASPQGITVGASVAGLCQPQQGLSYNNGYTPTTDGIVVGQVGPQSAGQGQGIWADISCQTQGMTVTASGGDIYFADEGGYLPVWNSFAVPVPANQWFYVGVDMDPTQYPLTVAFYFVPFGPGSMSISSP